MARTVRNGKLDTRSARARLAIRREPYWTAISRGDAIGYRKGVKGGSWIARHRGEDAKQHYQSVGAADDARDADGIAVLSFSQAQAKAREWFGQKARELSGEPVATGAYTVADAMRDYLDWFTKNRKGLDRTKYQANAFILPESPNLNRIGCFMLWSIVL